MKKILALFVFMVLTVCITVSPVLAGGDKNRGSVGQGTVDQGDTADAPGDNAQDNQAP